MNIPMRPALGMERIRETALSASLKSCVFKKGGYQQLAGDSWNIALAAGLWAKEVARAGGDGRGTAFGHAWAHRCRDSIRFHLVAPGVASERASPTAVV